LGAKTGDSQAKAMAGAWRAHGTGVAAPRSPSAARPAGGGAGRPRSGQAEGAGALGRSAGPRAEAACGMHAAVLGQPW